MFTNLNNEQKKELQTGHEEYIYLIGFDSVMDQGI